MAILRCGILVLVCSVVVPWPAHAADILLNGEAPCLSIGGSWSSGTCTVERLDVPAGTRVFATSVGLSAGKVLIDGTLEILGGSFRVTGPLVNRGSLTTFSFVAITGPMWNQGTWRNGSQFTSENTVVNEWNFFNQGTFESAMFINKGGVVNYTGWIRNSGGSIVNKGYLLNAGYLDNPAEAILKNRGAIENYDGTFFNDGTALSQCGSAFSFQGFGPVPGQPVGNPVEFQPCSPTQAVDKIGKYVRKLGQQQIISDTDTAVLTNLLFSARMLLKKGGEDEAVALLQRFNAEVRVRVSGWYGLGYSLILRVNRVLELLEAD